MGNEETKGEMQHTTTLLEFTSKDLTDVNFAGYSTVAWRESSNSRNLNSIASGYQGRVINATATTTLTIVHESSSAASPGNRIITPSGSNIVLSEGNSVTLQYVAFSTTGRWYVVSQT